MSGGVVGIETDALREEHLGGILGAAGVARGLLGKQAEGERGCNRGRARGHWRQDALDVGEFAGGLKLGGSLHQLFDRRVRHSRWILREGGGIA